MWKFLQKPTTSIRKSHTVSIRPVTSSAATATAVGVASVAASGAALGYASWQLGLESLELESSLSQLDEIEAASAAVAVAIEAAKKKEDDCPCVPKLDRRIGGNLVHDTYAAQFGPGEWKMTGYSGLKARYDSGDLATMTMYEAKTRYAWMNTNRWYVPLAGAALNAQFINQWSVATECGYTYKVVVNNQSGATGIKAHVAPWLDVQYSP